MKKATCFIGGFAFFACIASLTAGDNDEKYTNRLIHEIVSEGDYGRSA